jgi:4-hydroxy-tetrahydrodipicolinate reductase
MIQVLHMGLGPVGRRVVTDLHQRGLGRVVAAVDPDPALVGRPLGEVCPDLGADAPPVTVRGSLEEVEDWSAVRCALVTTQSDLELCMDTFRSLLERGKAVVSTCEELSWPWLRHPVLAQELQELAVRHGGRLLGTGVNPGFLMDALPVAVTTLARDVRAITVERTQDARPRRIPFQRKIGATLDVEEFERRVSDGTLRHVGLGESLHFVAHYLGFELERWEETFEPILADEPIECDLGTVAPGHARGVHQVARGWAGGKQVVELVFRAAVGEEGARDRIAVEGDPPFELVIPGGVHGDLATASVALNSMRSLLAAEPGLHTMASLPLQGAAPPDDFTSR